MNKKCQVFTPKNYVEELLNSVDYVHQLYGKKIIENSCGDGNILVAIVRRYIKECKKNGLSQIEINHGLSKDIYGIEIDLKQFDKCIENLNSIAREEKIEKVNWNVFNVDYLRWESDVTFDFVVGNPPYITYKELEQEERKYLHEKFDSCKQGKFDYCYAFIEKSIMSLNNDGKMAYLVPSSIYKTVFGKRIRDIILPYIEIIKDYTTENIFDNALVKSSIMILKKVGSKKTKYIDMINKKSLVINNNGFGSKWIFTNKKNDGDKRFGDHFKVSHVVATLLNEAYVLKDYIETEESYLCNGFSIEKNMIMDTATPRSLRYGKKEKIIFPYFYNNGELCRYKQEIFESNYVGVSNYLNSFRQKLDKRKSDKTANWFEYGRSQALLGLEKEKLLVSTIVTDEIQVYKLKSNCIPYAGMYITQISKVYSLDDAIDILKSLDFKQYILDVGIHINGRSLQITSKDITEYRF